MNCAALLGVGACARVDATYSEDLGISRFLAFLCHLALALAARSAPLFPVCVDGFDADRDLL